MRKTITATAIEIAGHTISVDFDCRGGIAGYFFEQTLRVTYTTDISGTPAGIALMPFVANLLPLVWLTDAVLEVPELDGDFYRSIPAIKRGYQEMYPMLNFAGELKVTRITENSCPANDGAGLFFSGGADSFASLAAHADEKLHLMLIIGADIAFDDSVGIRNTTAMIKETAATFGYGYDIIETNFREFIDYLKVKPLIAKSPDHYWHGFQHGIGIIALAAPLAFKLGLAKIYMASSYPPESTETCASHFKIVDDFIKIAGSVVFNDQKEYSRQQKLKHIGEFARKSGKEIFLRVCYHAKGGGNCCKCEKCLRTIAGLYAEGEDPAAYGLDINQGYGCQEAVEQLEKRIFVGHPSFWESLQNRMRENRDKVPANVFTEWVMTANFESINRPVAKKLLLTAERARMLFFLLKKTLCRKMHR